MSAKYLEASSFSPDMVDFLENLSKYRVEYVIIGGAAVVYYGHARLTGDIDIFYNNETENVEKLYKALLDFWAGDIPVLAAKSQLGNPGMVFQFGMPPNRIDLLNQVDGISFQEAIQDKETAQLRASDKRFNIYYIGLAALIRNKQAVGRPRDLEDLKYLQAQAQRRCKDSGSRSKVDN